MPYKDIEKRKDYMKLYYQTYKEKIKFRIKTYYQMHKEQQKERSKKYYLTHKKQYNERAKTYRQTHREKLNKNARKRTKEIRFEIIKLLGERCSNPNCLVPNGCTDWRCLQVDHINGGGRKEAKSFSSSLSFYINIIEKIKGGSKDYQLLCSNCNWIKKYERNETDHL